MYNALMSESKECNLRSIYRDFFSNEEAGFKPYKKYIYQESKDYDWGWRTPHDCLEDFRTSHYITITDEKFISNLFRKRISGYRTTWNGGLGGDGEHPFNEFYAHFMRSDSFSVEKKALHCDWLISKCHEENLQIKKARIPLVESSDEEGESLRLVGT